MSGLTVRELMVLELAGRPYRRPQMFVDPARELVGYGETRFWQVANSLLDRPEAEAADPVTVHRLRRLRELRKAQRRGAA